MIICPHCSSENRDGAIFCEQCRTNVHWLPSVARQPETVEKLRERLTDAQRNQHRWRTACIGSWIAFLFVFLFCMGKWGLPYGILGFLYLCQFAIPVVALVSILYFSAKGSCWDAQRKLNETYPTTD
jgi:hypothetical protein